MSDALAIATCRQLGVITVLLGDPLRADESFEFRAYAGRTTFPREDLDGRRLGDDFDFGRAFVGFGTGLPGAERARRLTNGSVPDCFGPDGAMRRLGKLVASFASRATGVILHRAGELVLPIDRFIAMLGDIDDAACKPFGAWIDLAPTKRDDETHYGTFGMDALGLPDVVVPFDEDDPRELARAHDAATFACYRMVRENRELAVGEALAVPVRCPVGASPLKLTSREGTITYAVSADDTLLKLTPTEVVDHAGEWADRVEATPVNVYQLVFDQGLDVLVPSEIVRSIPANFGPIPHAIEERRRDDGRGYLVVTNGFGRIPQRDIDWAPCTHVEVAAWVRKPSFELLRLVGGVAALIHESTTGGWKVADLVGLPIAERGIAGFVLDDFGSVAMGQGPPVRVLGIVPLTAEQYASARGGNAGKWLHANDPNETVWDRFGG